MKQKERHTHRQIDFSFISIFGLVIRRHRPFQHDFLISMYKHLQRRIKIQQISFHLPWGNKKTVQQTHGKHAHTVSLRGVFT